MEIGNMLNGLQFIGIIFATVMIYFTMLYYKRKDFSKTEFQLWVVFWVVLIVVIIFHKYLNFIALTFTLHGVLEFLTIGSLFVLYGVVFLIYHKITKTQKSIDIIVRKVAVSQLSKKS
ncbi:MAG: DUF2304 family protein [Nanohaloarchaea archaeon]|nr:DUF2304 family protein [Candidatus Nanohaloarchaea archaeon]